MNEIANYLLRILVADDFVNTNIVAPNDEVATDLAINFVGYEGPYDFELYYIKGEVARRVC